MAKVARKIDRCHSARAYLTFDAVAIGEASSQHVHGIGHDANLPPASGSAPGGPSSR